MSLPLSMLICLSLAHLCIGDQPVDEAVIAKKVHPLGAWTELDPSAKDLQDAVQFAVKNFNTNSRHKRIFKLVSVTSPMTLVTNMINFKFDAILVKTKCLKTEDQDVETCGAKKRHIKCHFNVVFDPRTNTHEKINQKCNNWIEKTEA